MRKYRVVPGTACDGTCAARRDQLNPHSESVATHTLTRCRPLPKSAWVHTMLFVERLREIAAAGETNGVRHLGNLQGCSRQQFRGLVQPHRSQHGHRRLAERTFEVRSER